MTGGWALPIVGVLLGAIAGSFLATLVVRWPANRKVSSGRSCCDACGVTLEASDLIPLLSYLIRRGHCRRCGTVIDSVHWKIELACALAGAIAVLFSTGFVQATGWMLFSWILIPLAFLDARHFWLPDALTLPLSAIGLLVSPYVTGVSHLDALIGFAAGGGCFLAVALGYRALRRREGLGLGDAKLLAALGAWLGWQALPFVVMIASILGLSSVLVLAYPYRAPMSAATRVPLGTFLCVAAFPGWWLSVKLFSV